MAGQGISQLDTEPPATETATVDDNPASSERGDKDTGFGPLGFSDQHGLGRGEAAYLAALGLSREDVKSLLSELRDGYSAFHRW